MADKNSFSLTMVTMTPKTAMWFCILSTVLILALLIICAVCGEPYTGHGSGGHGGTSDMADIDDTDWEDGLAVWTDEDPAEGPAEIILYDPASDATGSEGPAAATVSPEPDRGPGTD